MASNLAYFLKHPVTHQRPALFTLAADGSYQLADTDAIVNAARACLNAKFVRGVVLSSPAVVKDFLILRLSQIPYEVFAVVFLDVRLAVIEYREMFRGTLTQAAVYPREVVKEALELNAAAVILAHQHPSTGVAEPSRADEHMTQSLRSDLQLVDVRVIDHIVVAGGTTVSFAERGLL